jgi:hypothetical protein
MLLTWFRFARWVPHAKNGMDHGERSCESPQWVWSRLVLSESVRRTPRTNPAAVVINSRMA